MSLRTVIVHFVFSQGVERGARQRNYASLGDELQSGQEHLLAQVRRLPDSPANLEQMAHMIGIERWSQSRLKTLLGAELTLDEYDGYRPAVDLTLAQLADEYRKTRQASIALLKELQANEIPLTAKARHNDAGDISASAWFYYFMQHEGGHKTRMK